MSPSIDKIQPPDQSAPSPDQVRLMKATAALARFAQLPGLPPVGQWLISFEEITVRVYGGVVCAHLGLHGYGDRDEAIRSTLAAVADRFGGSVTEGTKPYESGTVHIHASFRFDGVRFAVWDHVMPLAEADAEVAS